MSESNCRNCGSPPGRYDEVECDLCEIIDFCTDCIDAHYIEYHPDSDKTKEILKDEPPFPVNRFAKWNIENRNKH